MVHYYCDEADLYEFGVPRGGFPNPARPVTVATGSEILSLEGHGFRDDSELVFRAEAGGGMPSPLAAGTTYYAKVLTLDTFQVAAATGGAAINITTAGSNVLVSTPLPALQAIAWASEVIDNMLQGNVTPLDPVPQIVRATCADLAAARLLQLTGGGTIDLAAKLQQTNANLAMWRKGSPLVGVTGKQAQLAVTASARTRIYPGDNTI